MLKQQARLLAGGVFLIDLALVAVAFLLAYVVRDVVLPAWQPDRFGGLYRFDRYLPLLPTALAMWAVTLLRARRYRSHRTVALAAELLELIKVSATATVLWLLLIFVFRLDDRLLGGDRISRTWIVLFATLAFLLLATEKLALRLTSRWVRQRGFNYRTMLLVGTGEAAKSLAHAIEDHAYWGFKLLGFVTTVPSTRDDLPAPVLGTLSELPRIVEDNVVDDVIFAVSPREISDLEPAFALLQEQGVRTRFALDLVPAAFSRVELEEFDGMPLLTFARTPTSFPLMVFKRGLDVAMASLLLLLGAPLVVLIALAIKVTSTGGVLYRQTRCGLNGRRFTLYKFRTMVEDAHDRRLELLHLNEMDGPAFKVRRDPRVTRLGRLLRKFSLDELPQLWNVLRGDMSLVGPRPPIPEEVAQYTRWQRRRLSMKPGLTCLWQISGRNDVDFNRWMELDLQYIDSWSPGLDFKILLKTIPVVLSGRGAS
ncbi:MAG TPA: sugar transferase [Thermoanaerobaculia bacterium]|nr:sugar transferase [Thermoanaerobaculia bacterium]